ncbi:TetR family transcriptional regulator [Labedaea rhizosphaerae]|uniref:TetR family transcriptional regulator n=2 Tax=Labedaea rhizosphaerae TaxID=598644 RepID=A0A4R6SFQ6_LABRH|nr:TetR family transcriptional regulator [Labedaea rhizosphaerae]
MWVMPSPQKGRHRRELLLRATIEVVAERGVAGVTHRAVTERAGVPLATASYYFSSIDELVYEALKQFAEQRMRLLVDAVGSALDQGGTIGEALQALLFAMSELPLTDRMAFYEILCNAPRTKEIAEPARSTIDRYTQVVTEAMTGLDLPQDKVQTQALLALGIGYGMLRLAHPDFDNPQWLFEAMRDLHIGRSVVRDEPERAKDLLDRPAK